MIGSKHWRAVGADGSTTEASLEFGRYRVLLRRRLLVADGVPAPLGARAFELLVVLLEANGGLVTKEQLMARIWPGTVVTEWNLKAQVCTLRKALGGGREFIRSEHGRGYRFTGAIRSSSDQDGFQRPPQFRSWSSRHLFPQRRKLRASRGWSLDDSLARPFAPARDAGAASRKE